MSLRDTAQPLVVFLFGHLRLVKPAEEGRRKDCFILLQIVPIFTWPGARQASGTAVHTSW